MWAKFDDALLDHRKIFIAGDLIGKNGPAVALGFYTALVLYANKHLTDGMIANAVMKRMTHVEKPLEIADSLIVAGLLVKREDGYQIHDYHDHNPDADSVRKKRKADRDRKRMSAPDSGGRTHGIQ